MIKSVRMQVIIQKYINCACCGTTDCCTKVCCNAIVKVSNDADDTVQYWGVFNSGNPVNIGDGIDAVAFGYFGSAVLACIDGVWTYFYQSLGLHYSIALTGTNCAWEPVYIPEWDKTLTFELLQIGGAIPTDCCISFCGGSLGIDSVASFGYVTQCPEEEHESTVSYIIGRFPTVAGTLATWSVFDEPTDNVIGSITYDCASGVWTASNGTVTATTTQGGWTGNYTGNIYYGAGGIATSGITCIKYGAFSYTGGACCVDPNACECVQELTGEEYDVTVSTLGSATVDIPHGCYSIIYKSGWIEYTYGGNTYYQLGLNISDGATVGYGWGCNNTSLGGIPDCQTGLKEIPYGFSTSGDHLTITADGMGAGSTYVSGSITYTIRRMACIDIVSPCDDSIALASSYAIDLANDVICDGNTVSAGTYSVNRLTGTGYDCPVDNPEYATTLDTSTNTTYEDDFCGNPQPTTTEKTIKLVLKSISSSQWQLKVIVSSIVTTTYQNYDEFDCTPLGAPIVSTMPPYVTECIIGNHFTSGTPDGDYHLAPSFESVAVVS